MWFLVRLLMTYILADERIVSNLLSKMLYKKTITKLTNNELTKLLKYISKLDNKQIAKLPKNILAKILASVPIYGATDIKALIQIFNPTLAKITDKDFWNADNIKQLLNQRLNPLYPVSQIKKSIEFNNVKFAKIFDKYNNINLAKQDFFNKDFQLNDLNDGLALINYAWEGSDHDILAAYFIPDKDNPFFGNCIIITVRGTGQYDFPLFPKATFIEFANRKDFGFAFWSYYYWKVYKGRGRKLLATKQGLRTKTGKKPKIK